MLLKNRKKDNTVVKTPYEGYTLPKSSEKGQPFIDWTAVLKDSVGIAEKKPVKVVKKKRRKIHGRDR